MYNIKAISMSDVIFLNNGCQCNFTPRRYSFFENCNAVESGFSVNGSDNEIYIFFMLIMC